jgi:hypothetical protein
MRRSCKQDREPFLIRRQQRLTLSSYAEVSFHRGIDRSEHIDDGYSIHENSD